MICFENWDHVLISKLSVCAAVQKIPEVPGINIINMMFPKMNEMSALFGTLCSKV